MTQVVEIVNFQLDEGYTQADFLSSNKQMNEFLKQQPGILYRSLCQKADGSFIDIIYWENMEAAKLGQQAFHQSPLCQSMAQCIAKQSVSLEHVNVLTSFCCDEL